MGKRKKVTVGYKHYVGMHLVLCHGPIDKVTRINVDEKRAWAGDGTGGTITINQPELFGGEDREGGIEGQVDIEMGGPSQGRNSYLLSAIGEAIPAFRRVVGLVLRQPYLGNSSYLKPWRARASRIHVRQEGIEQWYDEKAEIVSQAGPTEGWYTKIRVEWKNASTPRPSLGYYLDPAVGPTISNIHTNPSLNHRIQVDYQYIEFVWVTAPLVEQTVNLRLQFGNGSVSSAMRARASIRHYTDGDYEVIMPKSGSKTLADGDGWFDVRGLWPDNWFFDIPGATAASTNDMNPAHIIRECLTDPDWGMGYSEEDIDDDAFTAAADTLFAEELGMSLLWDKQNRIDEFVSEVIRHIDASLYVSRRTGKFVLKLIRNDYDVGSLILLNESNIDKIASPSRPAFGELVNSVTVNFWNTLTGKADSITVQDPAGVQMQGAVINTTMQYPGFTHLGTASRAAARDLRSLSNPYLSCTIYTGDAGRNLEVGSVFKLSWAKWGLSDTVMRVTGFALGDGKSNQVRINCVEDVFSTPLSAASIIAPPTTGWTDPSAPPTALPTGLEMLVEAPYYELVQTYGQSAVDGELATDPDLGYVVGVAARVGSAIDAKLWTNAGAGYEEVDTLDFAPSGTLTFPIGKKDPLVVLANSSGLNLIEIGTYVQMGDELARVDGVNVSTREITLGRGVLDTVPEAHEIGTRLFFWQDYAGADEEAYASGETINGKITPVSGSGQVALQDANELSLVLNSRALRPYPPGNLTINGDSYEPNSYDGELTIAWAHRDRLQQTSGTLDDHFAGDIGPEAGTTYRVRWYVGDSLDGEEDDISGTSTAIEPGSSGTVRVEVHSKRDGIYSLFAPSHSFFYTAGENIRITEDNEVRITETGDVRATED